MFLNLRILGLYALKPIIEDFATDIHYIVWKLQQFIGKQQIKSKEWLIIIDRKWLFLVWKITTQAKSGIN